MKLISYLILLCLPFITVNAFADYQFTKPVTIVVSFPPGGESDVLARLFADKLATRINQNVTVLNKPGASGIIGNKYVLNSAPEGYTLLLSPSTMVTSQLIMTHLVDYDVRKDFTPIVELTKDSILFISVRKSLGVTNHKELLEKIKSDEVKTYATPGNGSPMNILGEYYKHQTKSELKQIAYRGNPPAVRGFLSGEVDILIAGMPTIAPLLKDDRITVIGAPSNKRSQFLPDIPTFYEQGLSMADFSGWQAIFGPANMNPKVVKTLNKHFNEILQDKEVTTKLVGIYTIPAGGSSEDMKNSQNNLYNRYDTILKEFNITINVK